MLERRIPSTGEPLPVIGLGTWQTFDVSRSDAARLEPLLSRFVALGGSVVDSSPMYGKAEEVVGDRAARLQLRSRLFLATKVWTSGRENGLAQIERSARRLKTDRIDLLQVHNLSDVETQLAILREWKGAGRVRYIGITHYTAGGYPAVARLLRREALDFVQINYSLLEREAEEEILPLAAERGIAVLVNRPFGEGGFFSRVRSLHLPAWASDLGCRSWAQLALKWIVSHPAVTCAIPATASIEHLEENMRAGSGSMPDERGRTRLAQLFEDEGRHRSSDRA